MKRSRSPWLAFAACVLVGAHAGAETNRALPRELEEVRAAHLGRTAAVLEPEESRYRGELLRLSAALRREGRACDADAVEAELARLDRRGGMEN